MILLLYLLSKLYFRLEKGSCLSICGVIQQLVTITRPMLPFGSHSLLRLGQTYLRKNFLLKSLNLHEWFDCVISWFQVIDLKTQLCQFKKVVKQLRHKLGHAEAKTFLSKAVYLISIGSMIILHHSHQIPVSLSPTHTKNMLAHIKHGKHFDSSFFLFRGLITVHVTCCREYTRKEEGNLGLQAWCLLVAYQAQEHITQKTQMPVWNKLQNSRNYTIDNLRKPS